MRINIEAGGWAGGRTGGRADGRTGGRATNRDANMHNKVNVILSAAKG